MSIASEISRLQTAKADLKTAIEGKGVTVPSDTKLDGYADLVNSISGGAGSAIDWESIARGMVDFVTEFDVPASVSVDVNHGNVFAGRKVRNIAISDGNTTIANYAFANTPSLSNIQFPSSVTKVNNNVFQSSGIVSITLPATITTYGTGVFFGCRSLQEVIMEATTPPTIGTNMFLSCIVLAAIYVPDASVATYKAANNWSTYASLIKGISERPTT